MKAVRLVPLTALAAILVSAAPAQAGVCRPSGATLVRSNSKATVYKVRSGNKRVYYGCLKATGRQTKLATVRPGNDASSSSAGKFRLRGHFVAFTYVKLNASVRAFNLANGHHVKRDPGPGGPRDLVISRNGRLAWTAYYHFTSLYWSSFSTRRHTLREDGCTAYDPNYPCIMPGSLRLTGRHHDREIEWVEGRTPMTFVIP